MSGKSRRRRKKKHLKRRSHASDSNSDEETKKLTSPRASDVSSQKYRRSSLVSHVESANNAADSSKSRSKHDSHSGSDSKGFVASLVTASAATGRSGTASGGARRKSFQPSSPYDEVVLAARRSSVQPPLVAGLAQSAVPPAVAGLKGAHMRRRASRSASSSLSEKRKHKKKK